MAGVVEGDNGWIVVRGIETIAGPFHTREEAERVRNATAVTVPDGYHMDDALGYAVPD